MQNFLQRFVFVYIVAILEQMTSFYNLFQSIKRYFQDVVGYKVPSGSRMH